MVKIGNIQIGEFPLLLAPMEDVSDPPFRAVCKENGADMMYTEFISSEGLIRDAAKSVKKLDIFAHEQFISALQVSGECCGVASEEEEDFLPISTEASRNAKYVVTLDPLDGSSNIDVNVAIGTIFSIFRRQSFFGPCTIEDFLQKGSRQVAAGYIIYGSSTMMVYTTGQGAHGFTLDPSIGEFLLSHPNIRIPDAGRYLSVNDSYEQLWDENVRAVMRQYKGMDGDRRALSTRYVGSLVADFHRNLLGGGIFAYPANKKTPKGKLRLLYEANPLAFIVEQAGGLATDGSQSILNIEPTELHQRVPLYIGSKNEVDLARQMLNAPAPALAGA
jgi:fructose-1,6-bisphosphatase I